MEIAEHIAFVESEAKLFAAAAEAGPLDVEVPACPGWDMRELVRHLGLIHLWAAGHVAHPHPETWNTELEDLVEYWPDLAAAWPDDADLVDWYRDTNANLVHTLRSAPADLECFTFLPAPSPLAMWARRQASETAMHRFDAEQANGITSELDTAFAADVLDELLCGFAPRRRKLDVADDQLMHVHAEDTDDHWYLTIGPEVIATSRTGDGGVADLTVTGTAADLYLLLWNRTPGAGLAMTGNTELLDLWRGRVRVRWS